MPPFAPPWDDSGKCEGCGKTKDRVIRRINLRGAPKLCDSCKEEKDQ